MNRRKLFKQLAGVAACAVVPLPAVAAAAPAAVGSLKWYCVGFHEGAAVLALCRLMGPCYYQVVDASHVPLCYAPYFPSMDMGEWLREKVTAMADRPPTPALAYMRVRGAFENLPVDSASGNTVQTVEARASEVE